MPYTYEYPRPALTVDCVVFAATEDGLKLLLIERAGEPFKGRHALPGGFVDMDETTEEAARRELREETGLEISRLEQLHTFSRVDRDPRERVVSVAYFALVRPSAVTAGDDAASARWHDTRALPPLAFDHEEIVSLALDRVVPQGVAIEGTGTIERPHRLDDPANARGEQAGPGTMVGASAPSSTPLAGTNPIPPTLRRSG